MADEQLDQEETTDYTTDLTEDTGEYAGEGYSGTDEAPKGEDEDVKTGRRKKRPWVERCTDTSKWKCDDTSLWRLYMNTFVENQQQLVKDDVFKHRRPANLRKFPRVQSEEDLATHHKCLPLNAFQLRDQLKLPNKLPDERTMRIWKNMRKDLAVHPSKSDNALEGSASKAGSEKWPGMWPCSTRDMAKELLERRRQKRRKRKDLFPCDPDDIREIFEDPNKDYSDRKELGHARIPQPCPLPGKDTFVDRCTGERYGLVDGEYIVFELPSKKSGTRVYADVCLRGLKGMHLPELGALRSRKRTWKFCFYPAVIALLAKTQLRYKYAWSANIDYIYDHAWMLYTHIGMINVKKKQRLDDIVVYNYKYSVEVELVQELNDVPIVTDIPFDYEERNLYRKMPLQRKDLIKVPLEIGSEKLTDHQKAPVHRGVKEIEEWFDKLRVRFRNCIFRTTRFSVAFWKDNLFWYLYNPYRCDKFGYWDDTGYACIMKFCSKASLKRHLMILLLRAYVYTVPTPEREEPKKEEPKADGPETKEEPGGGAPRPEPKEPASLATSEVTDATTRDQADTDEGEEGGTETAGSTEIAEDADAPEMVVEIDRAERAETAEAAESEAAEEDTEEKFYTIQIFNITHHCCQIHNPRLLQRGAPKGGKQMVKRKTIDDCPFDPLDVRDPCTIEQEEGDAREAIEKPTWLKLYKITWAKSMAVPQKRKSAKDASTGKMRWHQYVVEESNKLFSLWGEIHITDGMFEMENRGMQTYACYVVCAGMTRIMAPEYWSSKTLDVIVMCGDRYYTHSKLEADFKSTKNEYRHVNCWNRYLMSHFKIGETMFEANVLPAICGRLYAKSGKYLWQSLEQMFLKYHFGILTCESSCLGIFKFCGAYYICDVNSFGPPLFSYGEGAVYLLRATYFYKFITVLVLTIGSPECSQFALNPIEILKVMDVGPTTAPVGAGEKKDRSKRVSKIECPYDEEKKKQMKRWKHKRAEVAKTIDKLCCKGAQ